MNILILNAVRGWSGIGSHSIELALALRKNGHNAIIGCANEVNVKHHAERLRIPLREIRLKNLMDIRAIFTIIKVALKNDIEIIVANLGKEYWPATFVAKLLGLKIIVVRHQTNKLKKITCRLLANHVDRVVAVSHAVTDALIAGGVPAARIDVVHNSLNLERFNPETVDREAVRKELGIRDDEAVIGTAGRLCPEKGIFELLDALRLLLPRYPSARLLFAGDGPSRPELAARAKSLSIEDKVIFTGLRTDMERIYAAMDTFVLASTCKEAFGMALIEAMAMERPVIATAVGGIPEIITDGENGVLIAPGDPAAIADAIAKVVYNKELSKRLAEEGRRTVERKFSEKAMGEGFEKVLGKL